METSTLYVSVQHCFLKKLLADCVSINRRGKSCWSTVHTNTGAQISGPITPMLLITKSQQSQDTGPVGSRVAQAYIFLVSSVTVAGGNIANTSSRL